MKNASLALTFVVLAVFAFLVGIRVAEWKRHTDIRTFYAEQSGAYLFGPSGLVDAKGEPLTRQQIIDWYLHAVIEQHPELGVRPAPQK